MTDRQTERLGPPQDEPAVSQDSRDVLHSFYLYLGGRVLARAETPHGGRDWQVDLTRAGFADLADAFENLEMLGESPDAYAEGLMDLVSSTGQRLRSVWVPEYEDAPAPAREPQEAPAATADEQAEPPSRRAEETFTEDELRRLVNLLRVGSLADKRSSVAALGDFLTHRSKLSSEELVQLAVEAITASRDPSLTVELTEVTAPLGISESKRARAAMDRARALFGKLERKVKSYWDGATSIDPLDELAGPDLVTVGLWLRRASDYLAGHVAEYMVHRLSRGDNRALASVVSAVVPSADVRLLPVLVRVLQDARLEARVAAIKAIAHIDDPRSVAALRKARRHASDTLERVILARALSSFGCHDGAEDILGRLGEETPEFVREEALKAVGMLPDVPEQTVQMVSGLVDEGSPALQLAALRALSHLGGADEVERIQNIATQSAPLRAAASRAAADLRARLSLAGDERFALSTTVVTRVETSRPGVVARLRSVFWYLTGLLMLALRRWVQGRAAAARASALNPASAKGHFLEATIHVKEGHDESALACYRRGLRVDPLYAVTLFGEANRVLETYLRHAESLERSFGRRDDAIEILEETEFIDLRSADPNLKIEVDRRLEALKLERRRERLGAEAG